MKGRLLTILLACVLAEKGRGDGFFPDWMPPTPPQPALWNVFDVAEPARPGEQFSDLLLRISGGANSTNRFDPDRYKLKQTSELNFVKVSSDLDMADPRDPRAIPFRDWKTTHSLNVPLPVSDSIYMFGDVNSSGNSLDHQMVNMTGRTGLAWKMSPFGGSELQFRTGTLTTYSDNTNPQVKGQERSQLSIALQAKLALLGNLQLQYSGEALPATAQADRSSLLTDVKLAMPLGTNREFYFGAKYKWEDALVPTPWVDRAQLYLGLKFER
jgi:hypothetical protein